MRFLIFSILLLAGCGSPCRQIRMTRCLGSVVEVCGSNKKWQRVMDCSQIKPISGKDRKVWTCGQTTTGCTCVSGG